jgi:hypothetical protein
MIVETDSPRSISDLHRSRETIQPPAVNPPLARSVSVSRTVSENRHSRTIAEMGIYFPSSEMACCKTSIRFSKSTGGSDPSSDVLRDTQVRNNAHHCWRPVPTRTKRSSLCCDFLVARRSIYSKFSLLSLTTTS